MKVQLIMLPNQPILVSDEKIKDDSYAYYLDLEGKPVVEQANDIKNYTDNCKKIIAGLPDLPQIDFSALSEEDCKKIGWVDIEKIAKSYLPKGWTPNNGPWTYDVIYKTFIIGFKAAQSLNENVFTKEILDLIYFGKKFICEEDCTCHTECEVAEKYIKTLSQPKVFDVEVEIMTEDAFGMPMIGNYPRITDNKIKILKVL